MKKIILSIAAVAFVSVAAPVAADPWKDESGHGKQRSKYKHEDQRQNRYKKDGRSSKSNDGDVVIKAPSVVLEPPKIRIK